MKPFTLKNILLVDDDEDTRRLIDLMLKDKRNTNFFHASSASEGKMRIIDNEIQIVVCDYNMADDNGFDLLNFVEEHRKQIPFILYTGERALETSHINYKGFHLIRKPEIKKLIATLKILLSTEP